MYLESRSRQVVGRQSVAILAIICAASLANSPQSAQADVTASADTAESAEVVDIWGARRPAHDLRPKDSAVLVVVFMGTECPLVQLYLPTLRELEREYRPQDVSFIGVFPNASDHLIRIAQFAHDNDLAFPVFRDVHAGLADALQVRRTPAVVVLDSEFQVLYRGKIDDQYRAGGRKPDVTRHFLREAISARVGGQTVQLPDTLATGCLIERPRVPSNTKPVTYHEHVAPILRRSCQACHREGAVGPFELLTYEQARRHAAMMAEVVEDRRMPPWQPIVNAEFGKLLDDHRLSDEEVAVLSAWEAAGAPEGDPRPSPKPLERPGDWQFGEADAVFSIDQPFIVPATGVLPYQYFQIQTKFPEHRWVKSVQVKPGNARVVHHIHVHITHPRSPKPFGMLGAWQLYGFNGEKARVIGSYLPGRPVFTLPDGHAMLLPRGTKLTFEVHYTPTGREEEDRGSSIAFEFADGPPVHRVRDEFVYLRELEIPAHHPHYGLTNTYRFQQASQILSLTPHMHVRGKHWRFELVYPHGEKKTILSVPRWDFEWQGVYRFEEPIEVPQGAEILCTAHWDNSVYNPNNPAPSRDVTWGIQSEDEMMNFRVNYVVDEERTGG